MSWFNRKPKNRRGPDRGNVLAVRLRSDHVQRNRLRMGVLVFALIFGTIFGFYLVWRAGDWAMNRLVYENKAFDIQEIEALTDGVLAPEQIRRWSGVKPGENLLALDLGRVKRDLEMVSFIRSVAVERVMPNTLRLRISEREPMAQLVIAQAQTNGGLQMGVLQVDEEGYVITPIDARARATPVTETNEPLPIISGMNPNQLLPGKRLDSPQVRAALKLIDAFERSPMSGIVDLREVNVSSPEILQVVTSQGSQIFFGSQDLDRQLRRWRDIYDMGQKMSKAIASLDLAVPNNVPARWTDASAVPPVEKKIKNPQRNRRRNV